MLLSRNSMLTLLGYEVETMSEKAKSTTAQTIVKRAKEQFDLTIEQVAIPGTRAFRYKASQIDRLIQRATLAPAA